MKAVRIAGILLLLWCYGMQVHMVIGAWREATAPPETLAEEHVHEMAQHAGHAEAPASSPPSKAAIMLTGVLLAAGAGIALWVIGALSQRWGVWASVVVLLGIAAPRIASDPRCWVAYDPTKHGCHTFMISLVLGAVGLALCWVSMRHPDAAAN
jgi:hypothetical protein